MSSSRITIRASAGSADITPVAACELAGFAGRHGASQGVHSRLEANAVAFRDETGRCALLLTIDTLFVGAFVHNALTDHFTRVHGQNADDLMILASHTHFAPSLDHSKPTLGEVDPEYLSLVTECCRGLIDGVMASLGEPVRALRGTRASAAAVNRRRRWLLPHLYGRRYAGMQHVMAPNPNGPLDPTITAILVAAGSDKPIALLWHFACHPTGFPLQFEVSADFPGVVRALLRRTYGEHLPILFLQGFAGDLRPRIPETRPTMRRAINCMLWGPSFNSFTLDGWKQWSSALADDVLGAFAIAEMEANEASNSIRSAATTVALSDLLSGVQAGRRVPFQRIHVASIIDLVALGAEPLAGLRPFIPAHVLGAGYLGDAFGYWPTDGDARHGGYEVNHFLAPFGLSGRLRHPLDPTFRSAVDALRSLR